jgi:hypothetical protein
MDSDSICVYDGFSTQPNDVSDRDLANNTFGDDFGFTALGVRECLPALGVSKSAELRC